MNISEYWSQNETYNNTYEYYQIESPFRNTDNTIKLPPDWTISGSSVSSAYNDIRILSDNYVAKLSKGTGDNKFKFSQLYNRQSKNSNIYNLLMVSGAGNYRHICSNLTLDGSEYRVNIERFISRYNYKHTRLWAHDFRYVVYENGVLISRYSKDMPTGDVYILSYNLDVLMYNKTYNKYDTIPNVSPVHFYTDDNNNISYVRGNIPYVNLYGGLNSSGTSDIIINPSYTTPSDSQYRTQTQIIDYALSHQTNVPYSNVYGVGWRLNGAIENFYNPDVSTDVYNVQPQTTLLPYNNIDVQFETSDTEKFTRIWLDKPIVKDGVATFIQQVWNKSTTGTDTTYRSWSVGAIQAVSKDLIYKWLASFGMYFAVDEISAKDVTGTVENLYLPEIDTNGLCTGNYYPYSDWGKTPNNTWTLSTDTNYAGKQAVDDTKDLTDTLIDTPLTDIDVFGFQGFLHSYLMDFDDIEGFASALNTSSVLDNINNGFFGKNPIDSVVSLTLYPVIPTTSARTPVHIAGVSLDGSVSGKPLTKIQQIYDCGNINVPRVTGTYADYEANYILYLPYIGTISLNASMVCSRTLSVYYIIDFINNRSKCCVYADNQLIYDNACVVGCQIPVSATNYSQMYSTMLSSLIPSSNMSLQNIVNRSLNIATASPDTSIKSACGDFTSLAMPQTPYLTIYTPQYKSADSTLIGTIDNTVDTVSSFGYVQGKLLSSINVDDTIKSMIDSAFAVGVYI